MVNGELWMVNCEVIFFIHHSPLNIHHSLQPGSPPILSRPGRVALFFLPGRTEPPRDQSSKRDGSVLDWFGGATAYRAFHQRPPEIIDL